VPWSSRILRYAKSKPNGKLIVSSINNGPYVRRIIQEPDDLNATPPVAPSSHEQTDDELTEKETKQINTDDKAIQTSLIGLPEDIYAAVDSCEIAKEIWERVELMMKGLTIGAQEKKAKLFNEWEKFKSTEGESIESNYHRFSKLMNDFSQEKHFLEKIVSNLKFLYEVDYTQLYDLLKLNQAEVNQIRAEQLMIGGNGGNQFGQYNGQMAGIQNGYNANQNVGNRVVPNAVANQNENQNGNGNVVAARAEGNRNADLDEIEEVNANSILMANLQQTSTSGTQTRSAPVYNLDGTSEVPNYDNCYDDEIFNMFNQEEQYSEILEPIVEPHQVQQNNNHAMSIGANVEQSGGTINQNPATTEEIHAHFDSLYNNLATEEKLTVSRLEKDKKKLKSDFKLREDELLDKQLDLEKRKMALGYPNPHYLKQAQQKQQSLYNGRVLLEKHDLPAVFDLEETLQLAQESLIQEQLVKAKQKGTILELKQRYSKKSKNYYYTSYLAKKIWRISASSAQEMRNGQFLIRLIHYSLIRRMHSRSLVKDTHLI
ncbi:hypothetical protein Tco_1416944, partial [Tanacetum coccineum]